MDLIVLALILAVFPKTNIYAVVFAGILFSLSMCVLNNLSIRKHLNFRNEFKNTYVKTLIAAAIMGVVTWIVYYGLFAITKRPSISMLAAILIAIVVYLIAFVVVTGTTEAEMRRMPMGTKLVKVLRILRIYR
jgi:stage V sporulation protein B